MQSDLPFYESPEDALKSAVQELGGAKQVGAALWPDKTPDAARTRLLDCLNPARSERLDVTELMFVFRKARDAGCHGPFSWLCAEIGYEARAVTKAEEVDRLTSVVEQSSKTLAAALATLEKMQRVQPVRVA
jgi:hypothetical protein